MRPDFHYKFVSLPTKLSALVYVNVPGIIVYLEGHSMCIIYIVSVLCCWTSADSHNSFPPSSSYIANDINHNIDQFEIDQDLQHI